MSWTANSAPGVIAIQATLEEIDAQIKKLRRCEVQTAARLESRDTGRDKVIEEQIKRQLANVVAARQIWIEDFFRTETQ